jgi:hypothetical protein
MYILICLIVCRQSPVAMYSYSIRTQTFHVERVPNPNTKPTLVGLRVVLAVLESCKVKETMGQIV